MPDPVFLWRDQTPVSGRAYELAFSGLKAESSRDLLNTLAATLADRGLAPADGLEISGIRQGGLALRSARPVSHAEDLGTIHVLIDCTHKGITMAHTKQQSMRRVLHREIAGTIGLLTDEQDFTTMRRYRTFTFDNHESYLQQVEALLQARATEGGHTTVALFDPEEYAEFCAETGLDPDAPASRTRFTAELATTGPTLPYEGQPLAELVPDLIDQAVRQATWEYAATVLARIGPCATCGEDIGRTAFTHASNLLLHILDTVGPGSHHLVCSVSAAPEPLVAVLHADANAEGETQLDETEALEFATVLAVGIATHSAGGLVMRTSAPGTTDRVYGWRLREDGLQPLTAAEVFDAYCTDIESGDIVSPESGVDYCEPPDLGDAGKPDGHKH